MGNTLKLTGGGTLTLGGQLALTSGGLLFDNFNGAVAIAGSTLLATNAEFIVTTNGSVAANALTIAAVLGSGSSAFTKAGDGSLILSAANTYIGNTNVNAGTLRLSGPSARLCVPGAGYYTTIRQGALLDLNGAGTSGTTASAYRLASIPEVVLESGRNYVIGASFTASNPLRMDFMGSAVGGAGNLTSPFIQFAGYRFGSPGSANAIPFPANFRPGDLNAFGPNFTFQFVPEPSTWALAIVGAALLAAAGTRRRRA
jgi:autotransporter-associated beta strand protein